MSEPTPDPELFDKIVNLSKRRGIVFQSAEIYGVELEAGQNLGVLNDSLESLELSINLAWTESRNDQTGAPLSSVDPAQMSASLGWASQRWPLNATLHGTFVSQKSEAPDGQFRPAGYAVFDVLANYRVGKSATVRAGLFNLSDKTYWTWADVRGLSADDALVPHLSAPGRTAGVSFSYTW